MRSRISGQFHVVRRFRVPGALIAVITYLLILTVPVYAVSPLQELRREIAREIVLSLPPESKGETFAVFPFENDHDFDLAFEVLSALVSSGDYTVVERNQEHLKEFMKELKKGYTEFFDEEKRKELGRLWQAKYLVFGEVKKSSLLAGRAVLITRVTVEDTETGEIVWAKALSREKVSPVASKSARVIRNISIIVLMILLLGILIRIRSTRRLQKETNIREDVAREIGKSLEHLKSTRETVFKGEQKELAESLKELELTFDQLRLEVETAPSGVPEEVSRGRARRAMKIDLRILSSLRNMAPTTLRLKKEVLSNNFDEVKTLCSTLKENVEELKTRLIDRKRAIK